MADANQQLEELAQQLERINYQFNRYGRVMEDTADDLAAGSTRRARELKSAADKTVSVFTNLTGAVSSGASAMLAGQKGASAFNSSVDGMASAATSAGTALALLAPAPLKLFIGAVTAAIAPLSMLAKASANMADQLYKGYAGLAKSGAAASDGMTGLREDARSLGLSMEELGEMVNIVAANSKDLALFGGSVREGRRRLTELVGELEPFREQFIALGLNMTDVFDATVGYSRLLTLTGQSQTKLYDDAAGTVRDYLFEVDKLTKLTGLTRKEQEAAREAALSEQRFAAKLEELRQQGRFEEVEELERTNLMLMRVSKDAAQGFRDIQTNNIQTEASQKFLRSTQFEGMKISQELQSRQINSLQASQRIINLIGQTGKQLGPTLGQIGVFDKFYVNLGDSLKAAGLSTQDFQKIMAAIEEDQKKQSGREGKVADDMLGRQSKLMRTQIDANQALIDLVQRGIGPTQTALQKFTEAITDGTEALDRALEMLGIGAPKAARREDQAALDRTTKALEELPNKIAKANENLEQAIKDKASQTEIDARRAELERLKASQPALERQVNMLRKGVTQESATQAAITAAETDTMMSGVAAEATLPAAVGAAPTPSTEDELRAAGIKIKYGDVQREGSKIQQNLIDVAQKIQESVPGFRHFSSFNDRYHQDRDSLHNRGRALDFVLNKDMISKAEGEKIATMIRNMGASSVRDEYNNPSDGATGPHIHVEVPAMAKGGITQGVSIAGEAGPEAVVPLPDGKTIPVDLSESIATIISSNQQTRKDMHREMMELFPDLLKSSSDVHAAFMREKFTDNEAIMDAAFQRTMQYFVPRVAGLDVYSGFQAGGLTLGSRRSAVEGGQYDPGTGLIPDSSVNGAMKFLDALLGYAKMDMGLATVELDRIEGKMGEWLSTIRMPDGQGDYLEVIQPIEIAGQGISDVASRLETMIDNLPKMADGGITQGVSIAGEAGPEAVIPLDGRTIPVEMKGVEDMLNRLTRLVELQSENNRTMQQMYHSSIN